MSKVKRAQKLYRREVARMKKRDSAARVLSTCFGSDSVAKVPAIDAVLSARLAERLEMIGDDLREACWQRGILPDTTAEALRMARFLAVALPFARAAQVDMGIPASVLLAEAYLATAGELNLHASDPFSTGHQHGSPLEAFLVRAASLQRDSRFKPVMKAAGDTDAFLKEIAIWSKPEHGIDLIDTITTHELMDCDTLHAQAM
ncbi:MAG TPA: hypothetical protein VJN64_04955 [Terriglobales bacterium]|nr:hypothetical protein [Terriglobales bacterium]